MEHGTANVESLLADFKEKKLCLLRGQQNHTVAISPASSMTAERMNSLLLISATEVHVALGPARTEALFLSPMNAERLESGGPSSHCISVEAREGITTGISAADRAKTVAILGEKTPQAKKLIRPGHVFPVRGREGGVLVRNDIPEGALDIVKLAGFSDAAAYVSVLDERGENPDSDKTKEIARTHQLPLFHFTEIIKHRLRTERLVKRIAKAKLPTKHGGEFTSYMYQSLLYPGEHIALVKGDIDAQKPVLTRVQPEFTFGDVFGGDTPNSRSKITHALEALKDCDSGVFVYLRRTDLGELESQVTDWQQASERPAAAVMQEYGMGAQILRDLGVSKIELLTTTKQNISGLEAFGLEITNQRLFS